MRDDERRREQARHFCRCVERMAKRVGPADAKIYVARHMNDVATVDVEVQGAERCSPRRRRARAPARTYSPAHVRRMFQLLFKLLLKNCSVRFGKLELRLSGGRLTNVSVTESFRPDKPEEMEALGGKFE